MMVKNCVKNVNILQIFRNFQKKKTKISKNINDKFHLKIANISLPGNEIPKFRILSMHYVALRSPFHVVSEHRRFTPKFLPMVEKQNGWRVPMVVHACLRCTELCQARVSGA